MADSAITFTPGEVSIYYAARVSHPRRNGEVRVRYTKERTITSRSNRARGDGSVIPRADAAGTFSSSKRV